MNTITFSNPIPEPLKPYFKKEFLYLLESNAAFTKLYNKSCSCMKKELDLLGWSLDRHLTWFMSHFSVEPADYEFCYIDDLTSKANWEARYDDKWEEWLDKLVAPSDEDMDKVLIAGEMEDE